MTLTRGEWERIARLLWEDTLKRQDAAQLIRLRVREHDDAERKRQRKKG